MTKKVVVAGLLGALALYVWGMISWMVLPWHNATIHPLAKDNAVVAALNQAPLASGVYIYPMLEETMSTAMEQPAESGEMMASTDVEMAAETPGPEMAMSNLPYIFMVYDSRAVDPTDPIPYVTGLVLSFATATLAAFLLAMSAGSLKSFNQRFMFVALIGVFAALVSHISMWNWMQFPAGYSIVMALDLAVGWTIAGAILAWRIKPETAVA